VQNRKPNPQPKTEQTDILVRFGAVRFGSVCGLRVKSAQVELKPQPYTQSSVVNRPYPKLAYKYFGPFKILERVGTMAYRLELPPDSKVHPVFHISQLKPFVADHTPVYSTLPVTTDLEAAAAVPEQVLNCRLVKKGNTTIPQVLVKWSLLPSTSATWED
jgi:hypothetical protein